MTKQYSYRGGKFLGDEGEWAKEYVKWRGRGLGEIEADRRALLKVLGREALRENYGRRWWEPTEAERRSHPFLD